MLAGALLILAGLPLSLWTIYIQFTLGRGTPIPLMATQKLIITGPYRYSRNPMALGAFIAFFGVAVWLGSLSAIGLALLFPALLLPYIKGFEEREMEARFGDEYLEYKQHTPFIIPRPPKRPTG
jgi:protein-S-isoprenylcysteine O-methyltransferase Ste14